MLARRRVAIGVVRIVMRRRWWRTVMEKRRRRAAVMGRGAVVVEVPTERRRAMMPVSAEGPKAVMGRRPEVVGRPTVVRWSLSGHGAHEAGKSAEHFVACLALHALSRELPPCPVEFGVRLVRRGWLCLHGGSRLGCFCGGACQGTDVEFKQMGFRGVCVVLLELVVAVERDIIVVRVAVREREGIERYVIQLRDFGCQSCPCRAVGKRDAASRPVLASELEVYACRGRGHHRERGRRRR